jgi:crotonobetainyl-CoA:carnitine CoA-transferase CaiB-like acyl-CoA transferase
MNRADGAPLQGIRVIDLSMVVTGPWTTHVLADYGADVIKVEPPDGDIMRQAPPARELKMGTPFLHTNRGKRSIVLDLKTDAGRDALLRLCATADVFIHNTRLAALERLKLAYADVRAVNPAIVYVSLVGFGRNGPYAARPAYDDLIQGGSGLAALFARIDGGEPQYVPSLIADRVTGLTAAHAVLAALFHRERTGTGQEVEVPMFETMVEFVLADHLGGATYEPPIGPMGYSRILTPYRRPYRTLDGFVCVLLYTEAQWQRFFEVTGNREQFERDDRLSNGAVRREHYDFAYGTVAAIIATRTSADWLELLLASDIPVMPLHDLEGLVTDEHLVATEFFQSVEHPTKGRFRVMQPPVGWSVSKTPPGPPAPRLGEHTAEVLREADLDR